ncbi:MAG: hypothetical protein ISS55_04735 [Dehalococcoidales bacterium]|nr:hypothetical protein [Dehalococcoidales bacterium]
MIELTGEQAADYFQRCYTAIDGLWCMKVEEKYGFDVALDIDNEVWKVFPKIQARKLKELTGLGDGIEALRECLTTKMRLEGYSFKAERVGNDGAFRVTIDDCPWHNIMVSSGRKHLSARVGNKICTTEFSGWAAEFGDDIRSEIECRLCEGAQTCTVRFSR